MTVGVIDGVILASVDVNDGVIVNVGVLDIVGVTDGVALLVGVGVAVLVILGVTLIVGVKEIDGVKDGEGCGPTVGVTCIGAILIEFLIKNKLAIPLMADPNVIFISLEFKISTLSGSISEYDPSSFKLRYSAPKLDVSC